MSTTAHKTANTDSDARIWMRSNDDKVAVVDLIGTATTSTPWGTFTSDSRYCTPLCPRLPTSKLSASDWYAPPSTP